MPQSSQTKARRLDIHEDEIHLMPMAEYTASMALVRRGFADVRIMEIR